VIHLTPNYSMTMKQWDNKGEGGVATLEFALTATVFLMFIMAIVSAGHLFFTHNALVESTRRGARYAASQCKPNLAGCPDSATSQTRIQNMVLYGTPTAGTTPLVYNLQASNIVLEYSTNTAAAGDPPNDFGINRGTVSVKIVNYDYTFAVGAFVIHMPAYQTTAAGESAGYLPGVTCP
jgi:Flp pilus assembly protein TadG